MNKRLLYALPATVLAMVALALAITGFLSAKKASPPVRSVEASATSTVPKAPEYRYLLATRPLSPGDIMEQSGFTQVSSPEPVPEAIRVEGAPFGSPIKTAIASGQLLTSSNLQTDSLLQALVMPGFKAMAVPVDDVSGVGGLLRPGDRVDVVASFRRSDKDKPAALRILGNVLVVAVRGVPYTGEAGEKNDQRRNSTVVLAVPEDKTSALLLASTEGNLRLVAIAPAQESTAPDAPGQQQALAKTVYLDDLFPSPPKPAPRRSAPVRSTRVQVFEGSESRNVYVR